MNTVPPATRTEAGTRDQTPHDTHANAVAANARHQALLSELIDMAMDMARLIHKQAQHAATQPEAPSAPEDASQTAEQPPASVANLATAFDRITRCVRRTVILAEHLAKPLPNPADQARQQATRDTETLAAARRHLARRVDYLIADHVPPGPRADTMRREAVERLDGLDVIEDLRTRPVLQIAAELCEDLHAFGPGYPRRTPADAARQWLRAHGHPQPPEPPTRPETGPPAWTHRSEPSRPQPNRPSPDRPPPDLGSLSPRDRATIENLLNYKP